MAAAAAERKSHAMKFRKGFSIATQCGFKKLGWASNIKCVIHFHHVLEPLEVGEAIC
jgi:hypothetical protein